jgi:hypothetical protein
LTAQYDGNHPGNLAAPLQPHPRPQLDTPFFCAVLGAAVSLK